MPTENSEIELYHFPSAFKPLLYRAVLSALPESERNKKNVINFILVSDHAIRKLNTKYRKVRRITDVISFSYLRSPVIGDIYISSERSLKQAGVQGHSWDKELAYLVVHGVLHLLGYTDYTPASCKQMFNRQDRIWQCLF